ncbi:MAG TPA: tellurium resistance protein TerA, partial [Candidatus Limnocylindria bacterium]|nr:tellurium resistance protein TerA [Candidatus Limnocylindria bacterium]
MRHKGFGALIASLSVILTACGETAPPARIVPPLLDPSPTIAITATAWPAATSTLTASSTPTVATSATPRPD